MFRTDARNSELLYAVPVTYQSFKDAYILHEFWNTRILQLWRFRWTAFKESIYTIQGRGTSNRKLICRLPGEIISIIQAHLRQMALDLARREQKYQGRILNSAASNMVDKCFSRLEKQGRCRRHISSLENDTVSISCSHLKLHSEHEAGCAALIDETWHNYATQPCTRRQSIDSDPYRAREYPDAGSYLFVRSKRTWQNG
jgi:hypothetical protein